MSSVPARVTGLSSRWLMERPKSASLMVLSAINRMFSDLMSLWMMLCNPQPHVKLL